MREIVLDTETTGLNPAKGDRLLEIGAAEIVNQVATGATFHVLVNPQRDVSEEAFLIHGHSSDSLKNSPPFSQIAGQFLSFIANDKLVIHNAEFDMQFLNAELLAAGYSSISLDRIVDTLTLARRKYPGASNTLDALCDRYRIDRSHRIRHGALLDAELLVEVYAELCGGRQISLALSNESKICGPATFVAPRTTRDVRLPSRLTASEAPDHMAHVTSLGETAIWFHYLNCEIPTHGA